LYTSRAAANSTLAAIRYQSSLARLVSTNTSLDSIPGRGSSVDVKRPVMIDPARVYTQEERLAETPIKYSNLFQGYTSVSLGNQIYNAVKLPDDFVTFTLQNLEREVIAPMAESVAEGLNTAVVNALNTVEAGLTDVDTADKGALVTEDGQAFSGEDALTRYRAVDSDGSNFAGFGAGISARLAASVEANLAPSNLGQVLRAIRTAHQVLGLRGVPLQGRTLVVGANWEAALMALDNLNKVNEAGNGDVLRNATLGRLYGFTIVVDYGVDPNDAFAFQTQAVVLATRTTAAPRGASFSSTVAAQGFTLRYLQD
ncbi:hypothetical protein GR239_36595, partial [Rhizobium leguminosarum]|nr:hypothetical protein [Rhizobium ruizarguesonis]